MSSVYILCVHSQTFQNRYWVRGWSNLEGVAHCPAGAGVYPPIAGSQLDTHGLRLALSARRCSLAHVSMTRLGGGTLGCSLEEPPAPNVPPAQAVAVCRGVRTPAVSAHDVFASILAAFGHSRRDGRVHAAEGALGRNSVTAGLVIGLLDEVAVVRHFVVVVDADRLLSVQPYELKIRFLI
jgi:hypothetical protein